MPEITLLGWFHTLVGILSLISGFYTIAKYKVMAFEQPSGRLYLILTVIAAASALGIFNQGGFNIAHILAILTLLAVAGGYIMEKTKLFGGLSPYFQATCYTATLLFHMIPAITDGLRRLPVDAPIVESIEDPFLLGFYKAFLLAYIIGLGLQILWLRRLNKTSN